MKITKAEARRRAIVSWWERGPWPCVILAVDPGKTSGWAILLSHPGGYRLIHANAGSIYSQNRNIESAIREAVLLADASGLPMVAALEDWGAGGSRGINQWIGLGEARGAWRRELMITAADRESPLTKSRIIKINMTRWRSRIIPASGTHTGTKWARFTPEEWKAAAHTEAQRLYPDAHVPPQDAAEAACIAAFAARSDEVLGVIPAGVLQQYSIPLTDRFLLEGVISQKSIAPTPVG